MSRRIIILMICSLAVSCSPYRKIIMKNRSDSKAEIIWTLKELDSLYKSPFFMTNSKTTKFELKPDKPYNAIKMSFGMGSWRKDFLDSITSRLESLEIKSASGTIQIKSSEEIYRFLYNRRTGIGKRKIEILVAK